MEKDQGQRVDLDMVAHFGSGSGITNNNFFTSLELAYKLWEENITLCGTLRKKNKFIPNELLQASYKKECSSVFAFRKYRTLVSYVTTKKLPLSYFQHTEYKVAGEEQSYKPDIILHYSQIKGDVYTADKLAAEYTV